MKKLVNYGFLSDKEKIRDWANALADKTDRELAEGVRVVKSHVGPLSLGQFRQMCTYVPPLSERIDKERRLPHKKSDPETIRKFREQRKAQTGI
jgi:hypothetical protein